MVRRHLAEYGSVTKTSAMAGQQLDISANTLPRWVVQGDIDGGQRDGVPTTTLEELATLKAENRRLRETNAILRRASSSPGNSTAAAAGHGAHRRTGRRGPRRRVDLRCPSQCGLSGRGGDLPQLEAGRPADRTVSAAVVIDALLASHDTPQGRYGRRKMTALLRRRGLTVSRHTVDRPMRDLGLIGVRRGKKVRTTVPDPDAKPGDRPSDMLERDFTAAEPNQRWVAGISYVRTRAGWLFVVVVVDAQRIVGWHASTTRTTDLVLTACGWRCGSASTTATPSPSDN